MNTHPVGTSDRKGIASDTSRVDSRVSSGDASTARAVLCTAESNVIADALVAREAHRSAAPTQHANTAMTPATAILHVLCLFINSSPFLVLRCDCE